MVVIRLNFTAAHVTAHHQASSHHGNAAICWHPMTYSAQVQLCSSLTWPQADVALLTMATCRSAHQQTAGQHIMYHHASCTMAICRTARQVSQHNRGLKCLGINATSRPPAHPQHALVRTDDRPVASEAEPAYAPQEVLKPRQCCLWLRWHTALCTGSTAVIGRGPSA
jgi:hypothetical protein